MYVCEMCMWASQVFHEVGPSSVLETLLFCFFSVLAHDSWAMTVLT